LKQLEKQQLKATSKRPTRRNGRNTQPDPSAATFLPLTASPTMSNGHNSPLNPSASVFRPSTASPTSKRELEVSAPETFPQTSPITIEDAHDFHVHEQCESSPDTLSAYSRNLLGMSLLEALDCNSDGTPPLDVADIFSDSDVSDFSLGSPIDIDSGYESCDSGLMYVLLHHISCCLLSCRRLLSCCRPRTFLSSS
jgi:hypothetical protein